MCDTRNAKPRKTMKHIKRSLISSYGHGYVANGNLIFTAANWAKILSGHWACAVTEAGNHPKTYN